MERGRDEAESLLLENMGLVEGLCRRVALRKGLRADEVEDFGAWAKLRLVQDDYRILRRFRGDASLAGFLMTVLLRLALDYVREKRGKWRPSKAAQRSGKVAVLLETLIHRDGLEVEEAIAQLKQNHRVVESVSELREMAAKQRRSPRRRFEESIDDLETPRRADERVREAEIAELAGRAARGLRQAVKKLEPEDGLIVRLLFEDGFPVSKISRQLQVDQRKLYTRRDAIFRDLRRDLEAHGVDSELVARLCGWETWSDALETERTGKTAAGPSSLPEAMEGASLNEAVEQSTPPTRESQ